MIVQSASADTISFTNGLDTNFGFSPLGTTSFVANSSNNPPSIPDNSTMDHTGTYNWSDSATGILFSFDVQYQSVGGNIDVTSAHLGVAGDGNILTGPDQELAFTVSNLTADVTGYIDGTVGGIVGPVNVVGLGLGFDEIRGQFRNGNSNGVATAVTFTNEVSGASTISTVDDALVGSVFAATALGDLGTSITVSTPTVPDPANPGELLPSGWRATDLFITTIIDIEPAAVPEPGSAALLLLGLAGAAMKRRRG